MIYTDKTKKALSICFAAHKDALDKSGAPYVFHPFHLAEQMEDEISCTVALLHDVVEDTYVTEEDLEKEFPEEVVRAVMLLTHLEGTDRQVYLENIRRDPVARRVKIADVMHNCDETRCAGSDIPPERILHWRNKYKGTIEFLTEEENG